MYTQRGGRENRIRLSVFAQCNLSRRVMAERFLFANFAIRIYRIMAISKEENLGPMKLIFKKEFGVAPTAVVS